LPETGLQNQMLPPGDEVLFDFRRCELSSQGPFGHELPDRLLEGKELQKLFTAKIAESAKKHQESFKSLVAEETKSFSPKDREGRKEERRTDG
jgi:hypothetical protein